MDNEKANELIRALKEMNEKLDLLVHIESDLSKISSIASAAFKLLNDWATSPAKR
ncbi:hypothetical protein ACFLSX_04440 [Calditrichota bacterium]